MGTQDKIAQEIQWLKSRVQVKEKRPYDDWVDCCARCGSTNTGNSPCGWWCNNCGLQSPCPCNQGNHLKCIEDQNRFREKSGLPPVTECCCGEMALIDGLPVQMKDPNEKKVVIVKERSWHSSECPECGRYLGVEARNYRGLGVHQMVTCPHCGAKLVSDFKDQKFVWIRWK